MYEAYLAIGRKKYGRKMGGWKKGGRKYGRKTTYNILTLFVSLILTVSVVHNSELTTHYTKTRSEKDIRKNYMFVGK